MATSNVYALKINPYYHIVTEESINLGTITFGSLKEGFVKALRMYNKNASRHITMPMFMFKGRKYVCFESGIASKTGKGYTWYWYLHRMATYSVYGQLPRDKRPFLDREFIYAIQKTKVKQSNALDYVEDW